MKKNSKLYNENLGQQAYKKFKELLFSRIWEPGDFVSQSELVKKVGIQISPMRDALQRLAAEGFIIIAPRKGVQIIPASIKTIREVFHFRIILEKEALLFFIENAHDDLIKPIQEAHLKLFEKTKNVKSPEKLREIIQSPYGLNLHHSLINFLSNDIVTSLHNINEDRIKLFRLDDKFVYTNRHVNETFRKEHEDIIQAILKRDSLKAIQKLEYHNTMALKRAMGPPYF